MLQQKLCITRYLYCTVHIVQIRFLANQDLNTQLVCKVKKTLFFTTMKSLSVQLPIDKIELYKCARELCDVGLSEESPRVGLSPEFMKESETRPISDECSNIRLANYYESAFGLGIKSASFSESDIPLFHKCCQSNIGIFEKFSSESSSFELLHANNGGNLLTDEIIKNSRDFLMSEVEHYDNDMCLDCYTSTDLSMLNLNTTFSSDLSDYIPKRQSLSPSPLLDYNRPITFLESSFRPTLTTIKVGPYVMIVYPNHLN